MPSEVRIIEWESPPAKSWIPFDSLLENTCTGDKTSVLAPHALLYPQTWTLPWTERLTNAGKKNCYFQHHNYRLFNNYSTSAQVGYGMVDSQGRPQGWVGHNHLIFISSTSKITVLLTLYHTNISMHILHTVLHTFPKRLTRRICLTIKSCFCWWSSTLFSWLSCLIQGWYGEENLDAGNS